MDGDVDTDLNSFVDISTLVMLKSGTAHNCSAIAEKELDCWGWNYYGQTDIPNAVRNSKVHDMSLGVFNSCVLKGSLNQQFANELACWGHGKLKYDQSIDVKYKFNSKKIALGVEHICILNSVKKMQCFGENKFNQIQLPKTLCHADSMTAGDRHTCALTHGVVMCWGSDK